MKSPKELFASTIGIILIIVFKRLLEGLFLIIPVVTTFAFIEIFLNTTFNTSIIHILGVTEILSNHIDLNKSYDEKEVFAFLMTVWMGVSLILSITKIFIKFPSFVNPNFINRTVHVFNFLLLSYLGIRDTGEIIFTFFISALLCLFSYSSAAIFIRLTRSNPSSGNVIK